MSGLEALKELTTVVADTGQFALIEEHRPQDATTNPSLLYQAFQIADYAPIVDAAIQYGRDSGSDKSAQVESAMDKLGVDFGREILKIVPGRVSTEVDARLSFDAEGTVTKARELIELYKEAGVDKERVLIKIASTWEGCQAARVLEAEGIHVNMTLIFNKMQAATAAEAGATLISPFVGRITDYFKEKDGVSSYLPDEDPGVKSVRGVFNYFKHHGYKTVVMGASFRNKEQILALAGCDLLTVAPSLLSELSKTEANSVVRQLDAAKTTPEPKLDTSSSSFLWSMNDDDMAHFKLGEGIRKFAADLVKLETEVTGRI